MSSFNLTYVTLRGSQRFYIAILISVLLHILIGTAFLWKAERHYTPAPQAAPILVNIIAPFSSTEHKENKKKIGLEQQASTLSQQYKAEQLLNKPKEDLVQLANIDERSKLKVQKTPPKPVKQQPTQEVIPVLDEVKEQISKLEQSTKDNKENAVDQEAQAMPTAQEALLSDKTAAQQQGPLNHQGHTAKLNWQQKLYLQLEKEKRYPRSARRMRRQGVPTVTFTMDRQGNVQDVLLINSSGTNSLDKEAVALVYRAQPLPRPPASITSGQLTLTVTINFSM